MIVMTTPVAWQRGH